VSVWKMLASIYVELQIICLHCGMCISEGSGDVFERGQAIARNIKKRKLSAAQKHTQKHSGTGVSVHVQVIIN